MKQYYISKSDYQKAYLEIRNDPIPLYDSVVLEMNTGSVVSRKFDSVSGSNIQKKSKMKIKVQFDKTFSPTKIQMEMNRNQSKLIKNI